MRSDQQEPAAGRQRARESRTARAPGSRTCSSVTTLSDASNVRVAKRQRGQIADHVQSRIIPGRIADAKIEADSSAAPRNNACSSLLPRRRRARARPAAATPRSSATASSIAASKCMHVARAAGAASDDRAIRVVDHDFLRASTMMVDPARQAASSSVNGSEARGQRDVQQILPQPLARRFRDVAQTARHGIQIGARLVAMPAGLSRSEKCLCRRTSNPQ